MQAIGLKQSCTKKYTAREYCISQTRNGLVTGTGS